MSASFYNKGFKQGAETLILDARSAGLTVEDAKQIIHRVSGTYPDKAIPWKVKIWTSDGVIRYP